MSATRSFDECACYNIRKAARLLAQAYDRALEPSGLNNTQFSTLASISGAQSDLTITALATKMDVDRTTLTRNLKVMARDGLVRIDAGADARAKLVALTPRGRKVFENAVPLWQGVHGSITGGVGNWSQLRAGIETLATAAREER